MIKQRGKDTKKVAETRKKDLKLKKFMDCEKLTEGKIRETIQGCFESTNIEIMEVGFPKAKDGVTHHVVLKGDIYLTELVNIGKAFGDNDMLLSTDFVSPGQIAIYFIPHPQY
jgi:hypothetical protein